MRPNTTKPQTYYGAFVCGLAQQVDQAMQTVKHSEMMRLLCGYEWPRSNAYYEGPILRTQNASKCDSTEDI